METKTQAARREVAALVVLEAFDLARTFVGHDYGNGQRANELSRRRLELGYLDVGVRDRETIAAELDLGAIRDAFDRVIGPRVARAERDGALERGRGAGAGARRVILAAARAERELGIGDPANTIAGLEAERPDSMQAERFRTMAPSALTRSEVRNAVASLAFGDSESFGPRRQGYTVDRVELDRGRTYQVTYQGSGASLYVSNPLEAAMLVTDPTAWRAQA